MIGVHVHEKAVSLPVSDDAGNHRSASSDNAISREVATLRRDAAEIWFARLTSYLARSGAELYVWCMGKASSFLGDTDNGDTDTGGR